jgi:SAM-dependent MidA family methyltransferase
MLEEIIAARIRSEGPISFRDFMEMCLYYPESGYYTRTGEKIGEQGDFYTSPSCSPLFAEMLARQIEECWLLMDRRPFTIVEYGAGPGDLCRDLLAVLKNNEALYQHLRYAIIEKSASMREKEKAALNEQIVSWHRRIEEIPDLYGCILSNELVDNFPVHQVMMDRQLMEVFVDYRNGEFTELLRPAPRRLKCYLRRLGVLLPRGFRTEINLKQISWIRHIAAALKKGFVITVDYGYSSADLYQEKRRMGTLMCYHRHSLNDNPYQHIGEQDITAHVNFSALARWGKQFGLETLGFTSQLRFLQALGLAGHLKKQETRVTTGPDDNLLKTFFISMGTRLKVLIQQKEMPAARLSGLQFAMPLQ